MKILDTEVFLQEDMKGVKSPGWRVKIKVRRDDGQERWSVFADYAGGPKEAADAMANKLKGGNIEFKRRATVVQPPIEKATFTPAPQDRGPSDAELDAKLDDLDAQGKGRVTFPMGDGK